MALLVNQLGGFGILTFAKESRAIIDAMTAPPNMARRRLVDLTVRAFVGAALWPKMDVAWFLAAHDEQAGRINWKDPGTFTLTAVNALTFTADRGFAGNGSTSYLDTGWDRATNGVQFTQNNAHASLYARSHAGNQVPSLADNAGGYRVSVGVRTDTATGAGSSRLNSPTNIGFNSGGNILPAQTLIRRNDGSNQSLVRDGLQVVAPTAATSGGLNTNDVHLGKAGTNHTTAQLSGASLGAYLDDAEALAFFNIWRFYMRAVGADT